ncbi:MAG TPA: hypothetical protein VGK96_28470 [Candidatus Sulfotelmatobacter sp.]|jgi:hypothetical protein
MNTRTVSTLNHRTTITAETPRKDGGKSLILEAFNLIHEHKQVGQLTVQFGLGGCVSSVTFDEKSVVPQSSMEFPDDQE